MKNQTNHLLRSFDFSPLRSVLYGGAAFSLAFGITFDAAANPHGMTVASGSATASQSGSQLNITTSQNAFLNWQSFNIGAGETTTFNQPNASSIVWNRINDPNPSQIFGHLNANGVVVLMNSSGFYFGPDSVVKAAGFVATTATPMSDSGSGGSWEFNGPPPAASIVNYGQVGTAPGGALYLIAEKIENHGILSAPDGTLGLYAGKEVLMSQRPDGRGLNVSVNLPEGSVDNTGKLIADAGSIWLHAQTVNQDGLIQANSIQQKNGVIELLASDAINLGANSIITANGDDSTPSAGGQITIKSDNTFSDTAGSHISVAGGALGGNGGNVELSALTMSGVHSTVDGHAAKGSVGGQLLLDPTEITLDASGGDSAGTGTIGANDSPDTLDLNVNSAFFGFSQIDLQAKDDITVSALWNLALSTGMSSPGCSLKLEAGNDIVINDGASIIGGAGWSVTLQAGRDFTAVDKVNVGVGNITFNGSGALQTQDGAINLLAGNNITVNSGFVTTMGGGSITAHALAGNIDTGSDAQGYMVNVNAANSLIYPYSLGDGLGGISTGAGGNLSLTAGGNVISVLPIGTGSSTLNFIYEGVSQPSIPSGNRDFATAGSGAYGSLTGQKGDVTIIAGGNVTGHYLVANGVGSITAGVQMDANGNPVKDLSGNYVLGTSGSAGTDHGVAGLGLSLISGGWNVTAAQDIFLQEVNNPNGVFDFKGGAAVNHRFDYAPDDYVDLTAGDQVTLGSSLPLPRNDTTIKVPIIYPSTLNITAGAGGVELWTFGDPFNQLILFPSALGSLTINTTDGGPLKSSTVGQIFSLIVSDSGLNQFLKAGNFGPTDHASTPIHLGSETPITLNISGDMDLISMNFPEAAQVNVGGDMNNCAYQGMNLSSSDVTSINVAGNINNRSAFTSINLSDVSGAEAPNLSYLAFAQNNLLGLSAATLSTSFFYDPATQTLTYQNISSQPLASVLKLLQNLTVQLVINGVPQWKDPGFDTDPVTTTVSVLDTATANALLAQYNLLGAIPANANTIGFFIGGGGKFNVSADNIDLGTTAGIQSKGVGLYKVSSAFPLANIFDKGADISIHTVGDLDMYSTSIASLNNGNIQINAGGEINVGSAIFTVNATTPRGIFSSGQGDVSVFANGNINVNGSRIAAYDGGNVTVESLNGDVNAGNGATGYVRLTAYYVDPISRQVFIDSPTIPGSGILATTFPKRDKSYPAPAVTVGNILVEAPNGNFNAGAGGVLQLPLNQENNPDAIVDVLAGYELRDADGNPLLAADIADGTAVQVSAGRDLNANGSGVIGNTVKLDATGNIIGVVFARDNLDISAVQNVTVTALAQGTATVSGGDSVSGSIIGIGGVSASGGSVDASLLSNNSISGGTTGQSGMTQGTTANATSQAASASDDTPKAVASADDSSDEDDKKNKKEPTTITKTGRVTVILPKKT